jgi:hypothetical protein
MAARQEASAEMQTMQSAEHAFDVSTAGNRVNGATDILAALLLRVDKLESTTPKIWWGGYREENRSHDVDVPTTEWFSDQGVYPPLTVPAAGTYLLIVEPRLVVHRCHIFRWTTRVLNNAGTTLMTVFGGGSPSDFNGGENRGSHFHIVPNVLANETFRLEFFISMDHMFTSGPEAFQEWKHGGQRCLGSVGSNRDGGSSFFAVRLQ